MTATIRPTGGRGVFQIGGLEATSHIAAGEIVWIESEDAFSGKLDSVDGRPREVAPFPEVNPLTGPIAVTGAQPGDVLAIHLADVVPTRSWGVSTLSPNFGTLSGTKYSPNIQPETDERVWIWSIDEEAGTVSTPTSVGHDLRVPLRPFLGTVAVAPAHDEVRTSVVPDAFGGNLDLPVLGPGATLYLRVNVPGALLYVGDGHYAQGDGEFSGTAVEGAVRTTVVTEVLPPDDLSAWPRIETDEQLIAVGCGRPLEEACRVAVHSLTRWVADLSGLPVADAYQLVSQACEARIGNLVNPAYTVTVGIAKSLVPGFSPEASAHHRLRATTR